MIYRVWIKFRQLLEKRLMMFRWPLDSLTERIKAIGEHRIVNSRASRKRFPIRGFRYWWIHRVLLDKWQRRQGQMVIADVGCNRGHSKLFVGELEDTQWVGLDLNIKEDHLRQCGYSELHQCDFDKPLPLADNSVDVVVFSHVIEHLLRPGFTLTELARILKPGGTIIAGSPVAPWPISSLRQWQLRRRLRTGKIRLGKHINSMDCVGWKKLLENADMQVEMLTGTFFFRWSGNPLENQAWWMRLNQLWGALFPSLGGEVYLVAHKPLHTQPTFSLPSAYRVMRRERPAGAWDDVATASRAIRRWWFCKFSHREHGVFDRITGYENWLTSWYCKVASWQSWLCVAFDNTKYGKGHSSMKGEVDNDIDSVETGINGQLVLAEPSRWRNIWKR